jgi:hypothetical protein
VAIRFLTIDAMVSFRLNLNLKAKRFKELRFSATRKFELFNMFLQEKQKTVNNDVRSTSM